MRKKIKKKIVFKTSVLDNTKKEGGCGFRFNRDYVGNREILATFGGLKLLHICNSVSPRMGGIRDELLNEALSMPKVSEIKTPKRGCGERFRSIKAAKCESKLQFDSKSDLKTLDLEKNYLKTINYEKKNSNILGSSNYKSFYNTPKINFDCSILPLPKSETLDSIFTYIKYKPTLRNPFKY